MPKRTNTFQQVVALIHEHMAAGATIEHSAMVGPIRGGEPREVDVLVTSRAAGHEVIVGIEACKWSRKADVTWVEKMKAKHDDLPTNKLVLYSGSGFTRGARDKAAEHGIVAVAAEQVSDEVMERRVLEGLRSIWPKLISLAPEAAKVWVDIGGGEIQWFKAPGDLNLFLEDGSELGPGLKDAVLAKIRAQWPEVIEQVGLASIAESVERKFLIFWRPFSVIIGGAEKRLYARKEDVDPPELHPIEQVQVTGKAVIEVQEVPLTHLRLGETRVAYGEVTLAGHSGVMVASDGSGEELLSFRLEGAVVSTEKVSRGDGAANTRDNGEAPR